MIDTNFLVGLANPRDKYHKRANIRMKELSMHEFTELFISDYVIDEFLNILLKGLTTKDAIEWGKIIYAEEIANIIYCNKKINKSAWEIFQGEKNERKPLNFTDCIVYAKSKLMKCDEILTYDLRLKNYRNH